MSELKEHLFCECDECVREYRGQLSNEMRPYYLKSEADKVIAELKADYREACGRLQNANLIKDEQLAATRHQKYKRCLTMAELCDADACYQEMYIMDDKKATWFFNWEYKWRKLAEKFKEAK